MNVVAWICRRGSGEMRYGRELFDASKLETPFGNRYLLTVDEGYYQRHRRTYIHPLYS